jgi:peptidylprolyl isomerase
MRRGFRKRVGNGTPANMTQRLFTALALALAAAPLAAQDKPAEPVTPGSVVTAAQPGEWKAIDPGDLLVMDLAPDANGGKRQVIVQLMPPPLSQGWVGNIRTLAKAHWWDGTSVYRVVDNWVTQWGDGEDDPKMAKPMPAGILKVPESEYTAPMPCKVYLFQKKVIKEECEPPITPLDGIDPYVPKGQSGFAAGWPVAFALQGDGNRVWPIHCYGSVGVARDLSPDTGTGAELYAVIGQAPRQLDRNIAVVGRVIEGIEHMSALPRGKGAQGVYDDASLKVPIVSVRLGNELPAADRPRFEYLASDSKSFAEYVHVKANRKDSFYKVPAGGIDVCNVQPPVRRVGKK